MEVQPMFNFDLDPGPADQSVLVWQHEHRSAAIWEDEVPPRELTCRHKLLGMRDWPLDPLVCRQLIEFGLYGVYKVAFIQLDYALITALVERWRPETHTFHLPIGEITITLQDVNVLLGLRVDGPAVTGSTKYNWADLCEDLLGRRPGPKDLHGSHVSLGWLRDNFRHLPSDPDEETLKRHTRAFVLALMSGFLYGDKSKHDVALTFLPLLRDFDEVAQLSWGSATLALLYRELCRASKRTVSTICGPLVLLQLWAWERLHVGRPGRLRDVGASYMDGIDGPLPDPLGCRWRSSLSHKENPRGGLDFYRDQFDQQKDDQVIWQPYSPDLLANLPPICLSGQKIWRTVAPLICFDVVEWHRPDRVLRQFGLRQTIPAPCDNERALHSIDKRGKSEYDWSARHSRHIELWEARESSVAVGEPESGPMDYNDPYMEWYRRITRKIISPMKERRPGQFQPTGFTFQLLVQRVAAIYTRSKASLEEPLTVDTARQALQDILDMSVAALQLTAPFGSISNGSASQAPTPEPFLALAQSLPTEIMQKPLAAELEILHASGIGASSDVPVEPLEVLPPVQAPESDPSLSSSSQKPLSWPSGGKLTFSWICDVMLAFDWSSRNLPPSEFSSVLPINVFDELVVSASRILKKEPNCVEIDSKKAKVVVVGDLRGQLHDLLFLMQDAGFPDDDQLYVFNGNYVDIGAWGLETFLLLLSWKVFLPERVYLLRGNHESESCTSVYGFRNEVLTKYGDKGSHVYKKCLDCFQLLPLASLIAGKVFTTHGGLFRCVSSFVSGKQERGRKRKRNRKKQTVMETENGTDSLSLGSLEELFKAKRRVLDPPTEGSNLIPGDILWSNPSKNNGLSLNKEKGIGLLWGPDCTAKFLEDNNLKLIIRGNEGLDARAKGDVLARMDEGYAKDHDGLITLFSAPDYPQFLDTEERYNNKGAYIIMQIPEFEEPEIHVFEAVSPRPKADAYYDYRTSTNSPRTLKLKNGDCVDSSSSAPEEKGMSDSAEKVENKSAEDSDPMEVDEKVSVDSIKCLESRTGKGIVSDTLVSGDKDTMESSERLENGFKETVDSKTIAVSEDLSGLVEKVECGGATGNTFEPNEADEKLGDRTDKAIDSESPVGDDPHGVGYGEALESRSEKPTDSKPMAVDDKDIDDTADKSESGSREANDAPEEATDSKPTRDDCNAAADGAEKLEITIEEKSECTRSEDIDSEPVGTDDRGTAECSTDKANEKLECSASKAHSGDVDDSATKFAGGTVDDKEKTSSTALPKRTTIKLNDSEPVEYEGKCTSKEADISQPTAENTIGGISGSEQKAGVDKNAGNCDESSKHKIQEGVDSESAQKDTGS